MNIVCRQGIYNREEELAFYEIMLQDRRTGAYPKGFDHLKATSISIDVLTEMGPRRVGRGKLVFVNVPAIFLEASMFDLLPPQYVGIELVENKRLSDALLEAIEDLVRQGFKFCIDDFGFEKVDYLPLLSRCHFVKIDLKKNPYSREELREVIKVLKGLKKGVIAKHVEVEEDYHMAYEMGFDYFQGLYLSPPTLLRDTRTIAYLKSTVLQVYDAIKSKDIKRVVSAIERDVGVTYKLLKFVNSAYFPKIREISSVKDAVVYLGLENVAKFTVVLAISETFIEDEEKELWKSALFRANLCEKLAEVNLKDLKYKAYLAGLFSLSWEIFRQKPEELARELSLGKEIVEAYENSLSPLGSILSLVDFIENRRDKEAIEIVAKKIGIKPEKIEEMIYWALAEAEKFVV